MLLHYGTKYINLLSISVVDVGFDGALLMMLLVVNTQMRTNITFIIMINELRRKVLFIAEALVVG